MGRLTLAGRRPAATSSMPMPARGERARVELDAHRVLLRAEHLHLGHAADRRDALGEEGLRVLVDRVERQRGRGQRQVEDGLIGGVHLLVRRRRRHVRRELRRRRRRSPPARPAPAASMSRSSANWSVIWVTPWRARRGHRVDAGDGRELLLERRGHRRGHRLGAGAGQGRADLDRREVDVGQIAHRQRRGRPGARTPGCPP